MIINSIYSVTRLKGHFDLFAFGANGDLITRSRMDLMNFKKVTANHPLIMGRKTFDSLRPKPLTPDTIDISPLPKRHCIVISSTMDRIETDSVKVVSCLEYAILFAEKKLKADQCFIIGGAGILTEAHAEFVDNQYLTLFDTEVDIKDVDLAIEFSDPPWRIRDYKVRQGWRQY